MGPGYDIPRIGTTTCVLNEDCVPVRYSNHRHPFQELSTVEVLPRCLQLTKQAQSSFFTQLRLGNLSEWKRWTSECIQTLL
uniref:Uncharacterized protein n=1 Tax=Utricularia reniformis TaxID=192314 RepID=A0A1Y0B4N9_9LAMI|nr:hypothetical protein AEK19_MT2281 [Utricularia reniformis]ART32426.1 hypothetical protein AEK19_MT2281 [Utricularia reniformis]